MPSARVRTDTLPLDVAMAEICLQGARVGALIAKLKAAGMTEHVGVGLETELGRVALPGHHLAPARRSEGRAALGREHERGWWLLVAFEPSQRPAGRRCFDNRRRAVFGSARVVCPMVDASSGSLTSASATAPVSVR